MDNASMVVYALAMRGDNKKSVGITELKRRASQIIATVQQTGRAVLITRNNQEVAMITSIPADPYERLVVAGLLRPGPKPRPLSELKLKGHKGDASPAIRAILDDRED